MLRTLATTALLLITLTASAQPISLGAPFPLANTRYGTTAAEPVLVSTGDALFAFWDSAGAVRMTRVVDGEQRGGLPILTAPDQGTGVGEVAAVWTGSHFVVAATLFDINRRTGIVTRVISATGEPLGAPVTILTGDVSVRALAFNGQTVLLLYWKDWEAVSLPLTVDGLPAAAPTVLGIGGRDEAPLASNGNGFAGLVGPEGVISLATFDGNGTFIETSELARVDTAGRNVAIASNGDGYLVVVAGLDEMMAIPFSASGEAGAPLTLEAREPTPQREPYLDPAVTWTGSEWAILFTKRPYEGLTAVTVDAGATQVTSRESVAESRAGGITTVAGRAVAVLFQRRLGPSVPRLVPFPIAAHTPRDLTWKALDQTLVASAASGDAVLAIWREHRSDGTALRAGIRTQAGGWVERTLADDVTSDVLAASAGNEFAVFFRRGNVPVALRFDRQLTLRPEVTLPRMPYSVASNGSVYVLAADGRAFTFTPSGAVGPVVQFSTGAGYKPSVASDGDGFLIAWIDDPFCEFLMCWGGDGVRTARFDDELRRVDAQELALSDAYVWMNLGTAWNGRDYVVAWSTETGQFAVAVPRSGAASAEKQIASYPYMPEVRAVAARGGVLVTGRDGDSTSAWVERVLFLDANGNVTELDPFVHSGVTVTAPPRLERWGDGLLAYLTSQRIIAAPQHASSHVTMALEAFGRPPAAPLVSATINQRTVTLNWSEVSGPVTGYRVEYRIGDGAWNEVEQWFGRAQRQTTIRLASSSQRASFRVRAWSDAGTGAYSNPISVNTPRRRAVR